MVIGQSVFRPTQIAYPAKLAAPLPFGSVRETTARMHVMEFTPDDARRILENVHPLQRNVSDARVREYLRDMRSGAWHEPPHTFDTIAFDVEGRLCNGLHRMKALAMHDAPLRFYVLIGVLAPDGMPLPEGDAGLPRSKAFVAGRNRHDWAVMSYLAEHVYGSSTASRSDIDRLWPIFGAGCEATRRIVSNPPRAPIRAAFVFWWTTAADAVYRQQIAEQWVAYCRLDVTQMWPSLARLYQVMQQPGKGRTERHTQFMRASYALANPTATQTREDKTAGEAVRSLVAGSAAQ
jgi:hypothetical protein